MYTNEVVIKILGKTTLVFPEIDQLKLRSIIEEVLCNYDIKPACTAIVPIDDMRDKLMMYIAIKQTEGLSPKTLKNYGLHLNRFANFIHKNVEDITTIDIRMYLAYLKKHKNLKNSSLNEEESILKSFFSWLEGERIIQYSPAKLIKPTKVEKRLIKALTIEDLEKLREACIDSRERALVEVLYATGARLTELVNLNKNDIDYSDSSTRVIGKGDKERVVLLSAKAKYHLRKYLLSRQDDNEALFVSVRKPYQRIKQRAIEKIISKIASRTDIKIKVTPHTMRHTLATLLLNNGADISSVQNILGHSSPATTQIYAVVTEQHKREVYKKHLVQ